MKMLLFGDISVTAVTTPLFKNKEISTLFTNTLSMFENKDFVFANLECAITESDEKIAKYGPHLKAPYETAEVIKQIGIDCVGLSNNHVFDYGKKGIRDTLKALEKSGIAYTGFGENYEDSRKNFILQKNGERIALIAVCEHEYSYALENRMGSRPYDEYDTMEDIRKAKKNCDRVIVFYHGGKEFCKYPSPRLHKLCHAMVRNGADVVLCQHSHCIGCYENYEGGHILYGQGNFHFVKPHSFEGWFTNLAVNYDTKNNKIEFTPLKNTDNGIKIPDSVEKEKILNEFEQRNKTLLNGEWKNGWKEFCESVKDNYIGIISNAFTESSSEFQNGLFSHYLDCEAHTDVWRELCPSLNLTNCIED